MLQLPGYATILILVIIAALFGMFISIMARYKRCPADKILVIYGKTGTGRSAKCIHGGAAFVWPLFQDFQYMSLTPISIDVNLQKALSKQNIRVDVPSQFTIGISTDPEIMQNAAERLLGLTQNQVADLANNIILGQLRLVIATMNIEEINADRDKFLSYVTKNVEDELSKIGLKLINVNITDIKDESGYIIALGREAAAQAINDAKKSVAEKDRDGAIGEANAKQEERVNVASADAKAVEGENTAKITIANSDATRREEQAYAQRRATAAEKVAEAKAMEEAYHAQKTMEEARALRQKASQEADIIVSAEISKRQIEIAADAEAEKLRRQALGQADAIFAKMDAEARGIKQILNSQAEGFKNIVAAAGSDVNSAFLLMLTEKLPEIVKTQVEAIKNIKIDKVTVWDSGNGTNGETSTAGFMSGLAKAVPPLNDLFGQAGMNLPSYLGTLKQSPEQPSQPEE